MFCLKAFSVPLRIAGNIFCIKFLQELPGISKIFMFSIFDISAEFVLVNVCAYKFSVGCKIFRLISYLPEA